MELDQLPFIIKNKYFIEYKQLVMNYDLKAGYAEDHHIICKSFFKYLHLPVDNSPSNIVRLLFRDHCKAHWLLYQCTTGEMRAAMANAFVSMLGFKNSKKLLELGLSPEEYKELQKKIDIIKNNSNLKFWTDAEINFLIKNYSKCGLRLCANELNRSMTAVKAKVSELGLKIDRYMSSEELEFLKKNYNKLGIDACARYLGRPTASIATKAVQLGLTQNRKYSEADKQFLITYYATMGVAWCAKHLKRKESAVRAYANRKLHLRALPYGTPIYCPELDLEFKSIKAAAAELNMSDSGICAVVNKKKRSICGLTFIKIDKEAYYEKRTHKN